MHGHRFESDRGLQPGFRALFRAQFLVHPEHEACLHMIGLVCREREARVRAWDS